MSAVETSFRPISPTTEVHYLRALRTAFSGKDVRVQNLDTPRIAAWSESGRNQLRSALVWHFTQAGEEAPVALLKAIPRRWGVIRAPYVPSEAEAQAFEGAAEGLPPHERAAVLLLLYLGLRAEEFCTLPRDAVKRGVDTGEMVFVRKGGREATLDVARVGGLLQDLLATPARVIKNFAPRPWATAGRLLSTSENKKAQYRALSRLVTRIATRAKVGRVTCHKLRHAFASRLNRDGASLFTIQAALNHKNVAITQKYVHPSTADVGKFMRGPNAT